MSRGMYAQLREVGKLLGLDCGDNSCAFAEKRGGMRTNGGCRCDLADAVKRALEPPAEAQGRWTREAAEVGAWYCVASPDSEGGWDRVVMFLDRGDMVVSTRLRWSEPLLLPPPQTEGSET